MRKEALLTYGIPDEKDNISHFRRFVNTNLNLMKGIANTGGYNINVVPIFGIDTSFSNYKNTENFLFYYTGHSTFFENKDGPFLEIFPLKNLVSAIEKIPAKKIILLDACSDSFIENYLPKKNTLIAGAFDMPFDSTLAMSIYDAINCRGKKLENLSQETFNEMRHNWIQCKKYEEEFQYA